MKPKKKIQKKYDRRYKGHVEILQNIRTKTKTSPESAYRAPGSRNPRKQG